MKLDCTTDLYEQLYARWLADPGKLLKLGEMRRGDRVLDLCGGTGIVALTALDWGASYAVVADLNPRIARWSDSRLQPVIARAESIDVSMRFVQDRLRELRGDPESDNGEELDTPFDLVVCRQAIGYVDTDLVSRAVARVLRPGGKFVFNAFKRPKFAIKSYVYDGQRFFEASGFLGKTVFHVQAAPSIGVDVTKFRWHTEMELDRSFANFDVSKVRTDRTLYYVCTKPAS